MHIQAGILDGEKFCYDNYWLLEYVFKTTRQAQFI